MAIMDSSNGENDVLSIWTLLTEVSEQLTQNRNMSVSLHTIAGGIKTQAIHSQTGFVLRRFNMDKPKEVYDTELERMNATIVAENHTLQNDNRQLSTLIREYEQTLENVMTTFRARAYEVQQHELALIRQYEQNIVQRETEALDVALNASNTRHAGLARVGRLLRAILRKSNGEDVHAYDRLAAGELAVKGTSEIAHEKPTNETRQPSDESQDTVIEPEVGKEAEGTGNEVEKESEGKDTYAELEPELQENEDVDRRLAAAEWALERECELARLERENDELRRLLAGVLSAETGPAPRSDAPLAAPRPSTNGDTASDASQAGSERASPVLSNIGPGGKPMRLLGGAPGTVGPFGSYKKRGM